MNAIRSLLWKDLRLARGYLLAASAVWVGPYVFLVYTWSRSPAAGRDFGQDVYHCGLVAGMGAIAVAALLAGGSFATEREDRSVDFLAYLPATRSLRLLSKGLVVVAPALLLFLSNPLIGWPFLFGEAGASPGSFGETISTLAASLALVAGTAWLASARVSAAAALLLGLLSPFFVSCAYYFAVLGMEELGLAEVDLDDWFPTVYRWAGALLGALGLALGCIVFLARDEA